MNGPEREWGRRRSGGLKTNTWSIYSLRLSAREGSTEYRAPAMRQGVL